MSPTPKKPPTGRVLHSWQEVLRVALTESEVNDQRIRALEQSRELERLADDLKAKAAAIKAEAGEVKAEFAKARVAAERGWIDRAVDCTRIIDAAGMVHDIRTDTSEVFRVRAGTPTERQEKIKGLGDPSAPPATASRPDKVATASEIAEQNSADFKAAKAAAADPKKLTKAQQKEIANATRKAGKDAAGDQGDDGDDFGGEP